MEITNLIKLEQNAIIKQQFAEAAENVRKKLDTIKSLSVTEENFREVKKLRAEFNKEFKAFDTSFKEVKAEVLAPWTQIETQYNEMIRDAYREGDKVFKSKIDEIQDGIINEKKQQIMQFFELHRAERDIMFVKFTDMPIKVNMSTSIKSMEKAVVEELDRIKKDIDACTELEDGPEIFAEYKKNGYDFTRAVTTVKTRKEDAERIRKAQEERRAQKEAEAERRRQLAEEKAKFEPEIIKPEEKPEPSEEAECIPKPELRKASFTVTATLGQLTGLVKYMRDNNIQFEQI